MNDETILLIAIVGAAACLIGLIVLYGWWGLLTGVLVFLLSIFVSKATHVYR